MKAKWEMSDKYNLAGSGASLVGYADIRDLDADKTNSMPYAISIAVALDASIIKEVSNGPTKRYYHEYNRVNDLLAELCENTAEELRKLGNKAIAKRPTVEGNNLDCKTLKTTLPHKTIATRAGLGWIGKSALLITEQYGAAVRLATVLTDAEFEAAKPSNISKCGECVKCVESCPGKAITGVNWELGSDRGMIYDAFTCCDTVTRLSEEIGLSSTVCGICINVCPWTQKYISRESTS